MESIVRSGYGRPFRRVCDKDAVIHTPIRSSETRNHPLCSGIHAGSNPFYPMQGISGTGITRGTAFIGASLVMSPHSTPNAAAEKGKVGHRVQVEDVIYPSAENIENRIRPWDAYLKVMFTAKEDHSATGRSRMPRPDTCCARCRQGASWPVEDSHRYSSLGLHVDKPSGAVPAKVTVGSIALPATKNVTHGAMARTSTPKML